jgi:hypothetical protein
VWHITRSPGICTGCTRKLAIGGCRHGQLQIEDAQQRKIRMFASDGGVSLNDKQVKRENLGVSFHPTIKRRPPVLKEILSAAPCGRALTLSEVALIIGNFLECLFGFGFLYVEEAVEDSRENAFRVCDVVRTWNESMEKVA